MNFAIDFTAILLLGVLSVIVFIIWKWSLSFEEPRISHSSLTHFTFRDLRGKLSFLPKYLRCAALVLFSIALIDPHYFTEKKPKGLPIEKNIPTEGLAIYLVLDQSGSMEEASERGVRKIDLLKRVTKDFINGRPNDMIGLVAFARSAQIMAPLTLDHNDIIKQLNGVNVVKDPAQDGTSIGYAIYKTVNLIAETRKYNEELSGQGKPAYEIKNAVIILVTDGFQAPSPLDTGNRLRNLDLSEAGDFAKKNHVRVYIVNVEPRIGENKEFVPQLHLLERVADETGGKFYLVAESKSLEDIYGEIDHIEKSVFTANQYNSILYERVSLYPIFVAAGLFCMLLSALLDTTVLRRIP